jgi:hypothetical protein
MSTEEPRSPTFDGGEAAERSGSSVADVSGITPDQREESGAPDREASQPVKPDEAAQIIP